MADTGWNKMGRRLRIKGPMQSCTTAGVPPTFFVLLFVAATAEPLRAMGPQALIWTAPAILIASMVIAWGAESAQFFIAQGFALAILAWLQTLPEFAVEAVFAWKRQTPYLMANLTGALRLLTGLGWPLIYFSAAFVNRRRTGQPLRRIVLESQQSVNVVVLLIPLLYMFYVLWSGTLTVIDAAILTAVYGAYLMILGRMPPESQEGIDDLELIPRTIVTSPRWRRIFLIALCFAVGGGLIYFTAEPFLASLMAMSVVLAIPSFVFVQWLAPVVSEFPELLSTFYFARTVTGAPMALLNMVSSNINQWTLLVAMLPVVFSMSLGTPTAIVLDPQQSEELLLTIAQALLGMLFLINMELSWWEAAGLFALWAVQLLSLNGELRVIMIWVYFAWSAVELVRLLTGNRKPAAFIEFRRTWREHVLRKAG
jgi:cation:H+ antiporter